MIMKCVGFAFIYAELTCTVVSAPPPPPPAAVCGPVREWSRQFQNQVADEMGAAPNSALSQVALQAIADRSAARACRLAKKKR